MNTILSLIIVLSIALGAPVQPSQPVSQPIAEVCMEDMPCWDSATEGDILPALSTNELEAWDTIATWELSPASPNQSLQYIETLDYLPTSFPTGYFAIASQTSPQAYHIMQWVTLYHA